MICIIYTKHGYMLGHTWYNGDRCIHCPHCINGTLQCKYNPEKQLPCNICVEGSLSDLVHRIHSAGHLVIVE